MKKSLREFPNARDQPHRAGLTTGSPPDQVTAWSPADHCFPQRLSVAAAV